MSDTTTPQTKEKVGIGAYVSLIFACVFFSGVLAGNHWWSVFDFTSLNGGFGKVVASVSQSASPRPSPTSAAKAGQAPLTASCLPSRLFPP